ncbi:MAG TPA: response regulator [Thermoanaerobaculia bacterium]|nr:response regulator [Thermoanaerobaculia bacterium]
MSSSKRGHVLIADSDASIRGLLSAIVQRLGCEPVVAADGRAAAELIEAKTFAAAVVDLHLPQMTGMELLHVVARTQPELIPRTVVTTTGRTEREGQLKDVAAVLRKPFSLDDLMAELQRCGAAAG